MKNKKLIVICAVALSILLCIGGVIFFLAAGDGKLSGSKGRKDPSHNSRSDSADPDPDNSDDDVSADESGILAQCPYTYSDACEWTFYPPDNIHGYTAFARDDVDGSRTDIFVFSKRYSRYGSIIENTGSMMTCANRGEFEPDESDISIQQDYYYVKIKYDSRIPLLYISLSAEYEHISVYPSDGPDLNYGNLVGLTYISRAQKFNEAEGKWGKVSEEKDEYEEPEIGIPYVSWNELQVLADAYEPCALPGGASASVREYRYKYDKYNIYDEIEIPAHVELTIEVNSNSEEGFASLDGYDLDIREAEYKLYKKAGSDYADITPGDFVINIYSENEWVQYATLFSNSMGMLEEGDYRLVIGEYAVDFELKIQGFEAW